MFWNKKDEKQSGKVIFIDGKTEEEGKGEDNPKTCARSSAKTKKSFKKAAYIVGAVLLVAASVVVFSVREGVTAETFSVDMADFFSGKKAEDIFPIKVDGHNVKGMEAVGRMTAVLTDVKLEIYSPRGRLLTEVQHNMVSPCMVSSGSRVLVYEHGNKKIIVCSSEGEVFTKQYDRAVIAADLNEKNAFTVAVQGERYMSEVYLYNADGMELMKWYSADNYVIDADVSPDSGKIAVALFNSVGGERRGSVYIIDRKKTDSPAAQYEYKDETILSVEYNSDGTVTAVGDTCTYFYDKDAAAIGEYAYGNSTLEFYSVGGSRITVLGFSNYGEEDTTELVTLDRRGEATNRIRTDKPAEYLISDDNRIYCMTGNGITVYTDGAGGFAAEKTVPREITQIGILPKGKDYLILTLTELQLQKNG